MMPRFPNEYDDGYEDRAACEAAECDTAESLRDPRDPEMEFANPGSALRAAGPNNPRNLPCPTCGKPNKLTPIDRAHGYQCDACADRAERGVD